MTAATAPIALGQINIVVRDVRKSIPFYRLLGVSIEEAPMPEWAPHHAGGVAANGVHVELDSLPFAKQWNPGLDEARVGAGAIPFFFVSSREEVDHLHDRVTAAGYRSQKAPDDAFWGARYAIVEDPDGNPIGLMSPIDQARRRRPPPPPALGA
jgi:uncharacterized glyoxalase superfamily protein PhnB